MHFSDDQSYTGTKFKSADMDNQEGDLFVIYDLKNEAMLMLVESEGNKFSYGYKWDRLVNENDSLSENETNWDKVEEWHGYKKIGSKNILGYPSDGYQSETENETIEIWVSRNKDFGMTQLFKAQGYAKQMRNKIPEDYPHGMVMEMLAQNSENGEQISMKVININTNADVSYSMTEYPTMSFGNASTKK